MLLSPPFGVGGVAAVDHAVGLLDHGDHVLDRRGLAGVERAAVVRRPQVHVAPALEQVHADEFEQQLVGDRRAELDVFLAEAREASIVGGLGRTLVIKVAPFDGGADGPDEGRTVAPGVDLLFGGELDPSATPAR